MNGTQRDRHIVPLPPRPSIWMYAEMAFWIIADQLAGIYCDVKRSFQLVTQPIVLVVGGIIATAILPVLLQDFLVKRHYWSIWDTYRAACYDLSLLRGSGRQTAVFDCERSATGFVNALSTDFHLLATAVLVVAFLTLLHWRARESGWVRSDIRNLGILRWAALAATVYLAWRLGNEVWQFMTLSDAMDFESTRL